MERIQHYFVRVQGTDGQITMPNKDLGLLKAHHYVLGYERRFTANLSSKVEVYYQQLYDLPVENSDSSIFATINEGLDYQYVDLVNEGEGQNYGVEGTVERYFDNNYYLLANLSLYNSTYTALDGMERNTRFNKRYLANIVMGREFRNLGKKTNQTLAINCRAFFQGGQNYIPLLRDAEGNLAVDPEHEQYYDYEKAFEQQLESLYQINVSVSYKFNKPKTTHEIFMDLQNVTDNRSAISEYYDESEPDHVGHLRQFGFFPNLMYKVYF